jgi:Signal transduction histidine kinase
MLSHELRTPLTPVLAAAGVLERDERIPEDAREDLQMIRRNVAIQSRLIDDLLDLTRLERGKLKLDTNALDVVTLLHETAGIVAGDLDAKDQRLALDLDGVQGCRVLGDGPRLQQVFWNLLKNATKFSPRQSSIMVTARRVDGAKPAVRVEVKDAGMGIEPHDLRRIFKPFEQVEARGKQRGSDGGLGLGLAIAKAIVEMHRGTIAVASEGSGRGATFSVELPLLAEDAGQRPAMAVTRSPFHGGNGASGAQILLVEDHEDTGRVLARLLRNAGHLVDYARSAGAAWALFQKGDYTLVISDLGLPDESGLALIRKMRERRPDLPGICLTGYGSEEDLVACREAGFSEHLTKPVDMQRLHAAIGRILGRERA